MKLSHFTSAVCFFYDCHKFFCGVHNIFCSSLCMSIFTERIYNVVINELSNDLEEMIYETAASLIAVDRNNINIVVEVNYSPDGGANSEIEQDAADNDSVTYVY